MSYRTGYTNRTTAYRYAALYEHSYFVSKDKLVVSSPTMARQIMAQTLPLYSFEDPSPIAEPSNAQRVKLASMPEWALGAGGITAHLPAPAPPHLPPPVPLSAEQEHRFSPNLTVLQTLDESAARDIASTFASKTERLAASDYFCK